MSGRGLGVVSLKSGKIIVLCNITLLSDPVTYGTLEVMVDWHYSKCVQACPNCIGWDLDWPRCYSCTMACTIIGLIFWTPTWVSAAVLVLQCCLATSCTPVSMVAFNKSVHADLGHGYVTTDSIMQHKNEIASNIIIWVKCFLALIVWDSEQVTWNHHHQNCLESHSTVFRRSL